MQSAYSSAGTLFNAKCTKILRKTTQTASTKNVPAKIVAGTPVLSFML